jgi:excisionase family DNA binding protein
VTMIPRSPAPLFTSEALDLQQMPSRSELELLTEAELAALLKVCRRQLYNWRIAGVIPTFKLGRAVRFRASEVAAALERHRAG